MKCKYLVSKRCPYASPASHVCMNGGGSYCGKWREFDTVLQLKKEKAAKRSRQAMKLFVLVEMAFTLSVTLMLAISMMMTENVYWQMLCVVFSGLVLWCFFYWIGEWTK